MNTRSLAARLFGTLVVAVALLNSGFLNFASGHADPSGDTHPNVQVIDGNFAVVFVPGRTGKEPYDYTASEAVVRMIYSSEGKLIAPRHPLDRKRFHGESGPVGIYGRQFSFGESRVIFQGRSVKPGYVIRSPKGDLEKVRLPWPEETQLSLFEDVNFTPDGLAITGKEDPDDLRFYWFEHDSVKPPVVQMIGGTSTIYDFPVASNLAFAGGRFWVAFIRPRETDGWDLVLWSWKPGEAEGRFEVLDSPAHWNCQLSMAAIGDRLCLAYHCATAEENYRTGARIVTVFRKAE